MGNVFCLESRRPDGGITMRAIDICQRLDYRGPLTVITDGVKDLKSTMGVQMTPIEMPTTMTEIVENAKEAGSVFSDPIKDLVQSVRRRL